ncbi:MAG: NifU family protein [Planctomycetota bacterium]|nr:NifU family protein [Planctomycetota bacterium]
MLSFPATAGAGHEGDSPSIDRGGAAAIEALPSDARRCVFVCDRPLDAGRWTFFPDREAAAGSPLAERLFAIPTIESVLIAHDQVTLTRRDEGWSMVARGVRKLRRLLGDPTPGGESWRELGAAVGVAIRDHIASGEVAVAEAARASMPSSRELRRRVQAVLDADVNPVVAGHGGGVSIVDVLDNVVYVRMAGGCQGCGLADMTLKHGVEAAIRDALPEVGAIVDLTDHRAGVNPYFRPS